MKNIVVNYISCYAGLPRSCWHHIFLNLMNAISIGICFFLPLYFVDQLHFDIATIGILMSAYGMGTAIGGYFSGRLCDYYSPMIISFVSILIQALSFFIMCHARTIPVIVVILLLLGISAYGFKTSNAILLLQHCENESQLRNKAINISHAASNFGLGISGVIIGVVSLFASFVTLFVVAGFILLLTSVCLFRKKVASRFSDHLSTPPKKYHRKVNGNRKILFLTLFSLFFIGLIISQLGSTYPIYIEESFPTLGTIAVSILFILDTVLIVLFQAPLSNLYKKSHAQLVMGLGAFLMGLGMLLLSVSGLYVVAIFSCCIWTTGEMLFLPTAQLLCYENGDLQKRGASMGLFQSTYAVSTVVGPAMGGLIYYSIGKNTLWYLSFVIGVVCLFCCVGSHFGNKRSMKLLTV